MTEYPVSPSDLAAALAAKTVFNTGLLNEQTLCVLAEGATHTVAEFRRPQKTALWLEGTEDAVRTPLPGLLLIRTTTANRQPDYQLWAITERPVDFNVPLYHAPLPNVFQRGGICWGTVRQVDSAALATMSLEADWAQLLGTRFGSHSVSGKSSKHRGDVRKMLIELDERNARVYPKKDLISARRTLGQALGASDA